MVLQLHPHPLSLPEDYPVLSVRHSAHAHHSQSRWLSHFLYVPPVYISKSPPGANTSGRGEVEWKTTLGLQTPITFDSPNPKWRPRLTARAHTSSILTRSASEETMWLIWEELRGSLEAWGGRGGGATVYGKRWREDNADSIVASSHKTFTQAPSCKALLQLLTLHSIMFYLTIYVPPKTSKKLTRVPCSKLENVRYTDKTCVIYYPDEFTTMSTIVLMIGDVIYRLARIS